MSIPKWGKLERCQGMAIDNKLKGGYHILTTLELLA